MKIESEELKKYIDENRFDIDYSLYNIIKVGDLLDKIAELEEEKK